MGIFQPYNITSTIRLGVPVKLRMRRRRRENVEFNVESWHHRTLLV
jgi:hypothetical protein